MLRRIALIALGPLAALLLAPAMTAAATPLPTPATPTAAAVTTTSITLSWPAVSGPVASYTVQVIDEPLGVFHTIATVRQTGYTHTGLTPDTTYEYRVVANATARSGYTTSTPSGVLYVNTAPLPDTEPPTVPGQPTASPIGTTSATITFAPATDNNRVAGYEAQLLIDGVWTDVATNNITTVYLTGLTADTSYTVAVVAFDPNGNRSGRSAPLTFSTHPYADRPTCQISIVNFSGAYVLSALVQNMTATPLANWYVTFTLPVEQTITWSFSATFTRVGPVATATPLWYFATIGSGGSASFGFDGSYPAGSPLPSGFALNGTIPCTSA